MINSPEPEKQADSRVFSHYQRGCPFLGLVEDPDTRILFPFTGAVCHRAEPVEDVDLAYQQTVCLTGQHQSCAIFLQNNRQPLPPEISGRNAIRRRSRRVLRGVMVILLFTAVGIIAGLWWVNQSGDMQASVPAGGEEAVQPIAAVITQTTTTPSTARFTPSPTAVPSATPLPTITPLPPDTPTPPLPPTFTPWPPPASLAAAAPVPQAQITVERAHLRMGPGIDYPSLGLLGAGERVTISGRLADNSWLQVCCLDDLEGWLFAETATFTGDLARAPVITDIPPPPDSEP